MKAKTSVSGLLIAFLSGPAMAMMMPDTPKIGSSEELIENVVYHGSSVKSGDLVAKATFRLEVSVPEMPQLNLPSCTATLISKDVLLTAAHCYINGLNAIYKVKDQRGETFQVTEFILHEGYVDAKNEQGAVSIHDIALVKIDRAVPGGIPAQLPKKSWLPTEGQSLLVAGYGDNGYKEKTKEELMKDPRVLALIEKSKKNPNPDEDEAIKLVAEILSIMTEKPLLWTKSKAMLVRKDGAPLPLLTLTTGQSVCSGDSGGPSYTRSSNSSLVIVGVHSTSSNAGCKSSGHLWWKQATPARDTFVPYYLEWIQSTMTRFRSSL